jgi:hypothetical protein
LFLYRCPSPFGRGRFCCQAQNFLLDRIPSLARSQEPTF